MKPVPGWKVCVALAALAAAIPTSAAPASAAEGIRWETDLATAQQAARQSQRLVWIHFGGPWCGPCMMLERNVFSQPGFGREFTADYVGVKIDPRSSPEAKAIAAKYGIEQVPFDVITTYTGQLVVRMPSPSTAANYVAQLTNLARQVKPESYDAPGTTPTNTPPQVASQTPASGQTASPPADERYADYYNRRQGEREPYQPPVENQAPPAATQPPVQQASQSAPASADRFAQQNADRYAAAQDRYAAHREPVQPPAEEQLAAEEPSLESKLPPGSPPLALDGYCVVSLFEDRKESQRSGAKWGWQQGDVKWGAIHRGQTYLFVSKEAQQKFMTNPDFYCPVCRGHDPVLVMDHNQAVPGRREFGLFFGNRVYLFSNEETLQRFAQNPKRYEAEIMQAMRQ